MKRTFTANLAQRVFVIDEDAYGLLSEYIEGLRSVFGNNADADEIVNDMEGRMAEICEEFTGDGHRVITVDDVREVIRRMGTVESFFEESGEAECDSASTAAPEARRRLYRDSNDKLVGGVCGGIAAYLDVDPVWVRIAFVLLFLCFNGIMLAVYLLLWIILPEANNVGSRLEMNGIRPSLETIGRSVTDGYRQVRSSVAANSSLLGRICAVVVTVAATALKVLLAVLAIVAVPLLVAACLALVAGLIGVSLSLMGHGAVIVSVFPGAAFVGTPGWLCTQLSGFALIVGIPLFCVLRWALGLIFRSVRPMGSGVAWTLFFLWCIGIAMAITGGVALYGI